MKQHRLKSALKVAAALALTSVGAFSTASATQQQSQIALQLGAIQLGYSTNSSWTNNPQLLANALQQGTYALAATLSNAYTSYVPPATKATVPAAQSAAFRAQLYAATLAALTNPITILTKAVVPVTIVNGKTGKQSTVKATLNFNPTLTTATAISAIATATIPDLGPGLVQTAVSASMAYTTNAAGVVFPIFGTQPSATKVAGATTPQAVLTLNEKTAATQLVNASAVAKASLAAAVKAYKSGTKQWAKVPSTGPAENGVYLPNFSTTPIGPTGNPQAANLAGLADAAAAVAANAINGLGALNTNSATTTAGLYGQTASNVVALTKSLTQAAAAVQATSVSSKAAHYPSGAIGAETLGLITQVAGVNDTEWATAASASIMDGVVKGAVLAVGKTSANLTAVATGIAQGFYATYLETVPQGTTPLTPNQFAGSNGSGFNNASDILGAFKLAGVTQTELTKLGLTPTQIGTYFNNVYVASGGGTNPVWSSTISGAAGINLGVGTNVTPLLNGVGTPVTDTVGLK
jgi:hypothetical protein